MNHTITYEITDEIWRDHLRTQFGLKNIFRLLIICSLYGGCSVVVAYFFGSSIGFIALIVVAIITVLLCIFFWYQMVKNTRLILANLKKLPHRTLTITFTPDNLQIEEPAKQREIPWNELEKIEDYRCYCHFYFSPTQYFFIPAEKITPELFLFMRKKATEHQVPMFQITDGALFQVRSEINKEATKKQIDDESKTASSDLWYWLLIGVAIMATFFIMSGDQRIVKQLRVKAGKPGVIPFKIANGQFLTLTLHVKSGDPVNVMIGQSPTIKGANLHVETANLLDVQNIRDLQEKRKWPHSSVGVVLVTSKNKSEVSLTIEVSTN